MAEVSLMPGHEDSFSFHDTTFTLPLTIDPTCIDTTPWDPSHCGSSLNRNHNLPNINTTPPRRRASFMLHQTPPSLTSEPSSAASTFAYSNASGMLTPYTSSSVCSSRRPSIAHIDTPVRLHHVTPSPRHYTDSYLPPSPLYNYTDNTLAFDDLKQPFRRDSMLSHTGDGPQAFLHDLALPDTPISLPCSSIDSPSTFSQPDLLPLHAAALPQTLQLQPAPDFNDSSTPRTASWPTDQFDFGSQSPSPTSWDHLSITPQKMLHARTRDDCRITKSARKSNPRLLDAGPYEIQDRTHRKPTKPQTIFACPHPGCDQRFGRPEHCNRHQMTHDPVGKEVLCPLCDKGIKQRRDNLKAHIIRTHFTPAEKKKTEKMNARHSMKDIYERLRDPTTLSPKEQELWLDIFKKPSNEDLYGIRPPGSPVVAQSAASPRMSLHEIWPRVREMDARFARLLSDRMTIHDREKVKGDAEGMESGKLTKFWRMLGWSIAETQNILASDVAAEWDGPASTTLWDLDPRRKAMLNGTLSVEDAEETLGVDMATTQQMGLEQFDPRWTTLHTGEMTLEDAEKNGVGHLHASWHLRGLKSRRRM